MKKIHTLICFIFILGSLNCDQAASDVKRDNPFDQKANNYGKIPEINLKQGGVNILSGGSFNIGNVVSGSSGSPVTFVIENTGTGDLSISSVSSSDQAQFFISSTDMNPTITGGSNTSFTVTFKPSSAGLKTAILTISNNDSDEGSYTINLTGKGYDPITRNGLVAEYLFSGSANDTSGNNNNGTVNGAILTSDRFGNSSKAYSFDGVNNFIQVPHNSSLNLPVITIATWVISNVQVAANNMIVWKGTSWASDNFEYLLQLDNSNNWPLFAVRERIPYSIWNTSISATEWIFLSGIYDGVNQKLYVNGELKVTTSKSSPSASINDLFIGLFPESTQYYRGKIDDIRIYNRALTDAEISSLYHEGGW